MKKLRLTYIILLIISTIKGFSQEPVLSINSWKFTSLSAELGLKTGYSYLDMDSYVKEKEKYTNIAGLLKLNAKSYIWHPNFIKLDINANFDPGLDNRNYSIIPGHRLLKSTNSFGIKTVVFDSRPITLRSFVNGSTSFYKSDNFDNVMEYSLNWGTNFQLTNKYFLFDVGYFSNRSSIENIETERKNRMFQNKVFTSISKSFFKKDRNTLSYTYNDFRNIYISKNELINYTSQINYINQVAFDYQRKYTSKTIINNYKQSGSIDLERFYVNENLSFLLPNKFKFIGRYRYEKNRQLDNIIIRNDVDANLSHKLYHSLSSKVFYRINSLSSSGFMENRHIVGLKLNYTKKIAFGVFRLNYNYLLEINQLSRQVQDIDIINEEYLLSDGVLTIIERPDIDRNTLLVSDQTGTMIYQENIDYNLIDRGVYVEIQRIPGGLIPDNTSVYLSYTVSVDGSVNYDNNNHGVSCNLTLFKNIINLFGFYNKRDYINIDNPEALVINEYTKKKIGLKLNYQFINAEAEYVDYNDIILPFLMTSYKISSFKNFRKMAVSLYANYTYYNFTEIDRTRRFINITSKFAYRIKPGLKINTDIGYRLHDEAETRLEDVVTKVKLTSSVRKFQASVLIDNYFRSFNTHRYAYYGVFLELTRKL